MHVILFDPPGIRENLLPFTYTRAVADIRIGILTIQRKWKKYLAQAGEHELHIDTQPYLQHLYSAFSGGEGLYINGGVCPTPLLVEQVLNLQSGQRIKWNGNTVAYKGQRDDDSRELDSIQYQGELVVLNNRWDIFKQNGAAIQADFDLLTKARPTQILNHTNKVLGDDFFVEEGAEVNCAIINSMTGPVYIGKNAEIMEGAVIRGPFAMLDNSVVKLSAKIYGPTTLGPYVKVGGEINNSVFFGYSNKAHDGFLGNSVIGEWCNLGADTNNSNLKNDYGNVKSWDYTKDSFTDSGLQFLGLMMGDHSKCGINSMFNTGTVVGVSSNVFGSGFPRTFIPSYSWGGAAKMSTYQFEKAMAVAEKVMERRGKTLSEQDRNLLKEVFEQTAKYRNA